MPDNNQQGQQQPGATQGQQQGDPGQTGAQQGQQRLSTAEGQGQGQQEQTPPSFDAWLAQQDETIKGLISERFKTLETTVRATRSERDEMAKQVREAAKQLEEGSAARKALDEVSAKLEETERRASFYEEALKPDIACANPKLAYMAATTEGLIDGRGRINWDGLKAAYPELFQRKMAVPPGNAGNGAGQQGQAPAAKSMNAFIRQAAGR